MRSAAIIAATLILSAPALGEEMPARKPGLWEMKMMAEGGGMPPQTMKQCIDAATDKAMQSQFGGGAQGTCSKQDVKKAGATTTIDSVCNVGGATTTSHIVVTGSFDSGYTMKISSTAAGGRAPGETRMTIEAKHLGACQAGQKPGDIIMAGGMKMNVLDMQKLGAGAGAGGMMPGGMMPGR
jgi:hypothetical protein